MHNIGLFIQGVACSNDMFFVTDGKFKLTGQHVSQLLVRVIVHRADCTLLKVYLNRHHVTVVSKNAPGNAIAQIFKRGLFMKNKNPASLLNNKTMFH